MSEASEFRIPRSGEIWQGHGGIMFEVVTPAEHFVTGDDLVVYKAQDGSTPAYVATLEAFHTFLRPIKTDVDTPADAAVPAEKDEFSEEEFLAEFFDQKSSQSQIDLINMNWKKMTDRIVDNIGIGIDMPIRPGTIDERLIELTGVLRTKSRYEIGRDRLRGN